MEISKFVKIGSGPNLVFLHGWKHNKNSWVKIAGLLQADFTCWVIDLPGFGDNAEELKDISPVGYAAWVEDFLKEQRVDDFFLLGHSFGGRIATIMAARNSKVKKLVLYGAPVFRTDEAKTKVFAFIAQKLGIKNVPWVSDKLRSKDYREAGELREIFLAAIKVDLRDKLPQINCPTLLLWGENDSEVPRETALEIKNAVPNSSLYLIPNTTHHAHLENPNLFAAKVRGFLKDGNT